MRTLIIKRLRKLNNLAENDFVKNTTYVETVEIVDTINSNNQNLEKQIEDAYKKIPATINFNVTKDFKSLTEINFDVRIVSTSKNLASEK